MLPATQGGSVDKDLVNEMSQKGHLRKTREKRLQVIRHSVINGAKQLMNQK